MANCIISNDIMSAEGENIVARRIPNICRDKKLEVYISGGR